MEQSSHERKVYFRYVAELSGTMLLYAVVLIIALDVTNPMKTGLLKTLILITPMGPFLLMIWVIARVLRRVDEYERMRTLEEIVIAAAVTAAWTFTYGFLEDAGYPRLSMFTVWPVMGAVWAFAKIIRCSRSR
jgi:hypothetical protein